MKVHVVLQLVGGLPEDPEIFTEVGPARSRYNALLAEYGLNPEDPHDNDHDLYLWEGLIAGAGDACPRHGSTRSNS